MAPNRATNALTRFTGQLILISLALMPVSSALVLAQSTDNKAASSAENGSRIVAAMQASNEGFVDAVVVPALSQFASAAMFLEGASAVFDAYPDNDSLNAFREQLAETTALRHAISSFDFGPVHSLGLAAAMDTRLDTASLNELISMENHDHALLMAASSKPWLQGFEALHYLLNERQDSKQAQDFTNAERHYLHLLSSKLRETARALLDSWTTSIEGYPVYHTALSTAGEPDNPFYLTVQAASEEILRGVINALGASNDSMTSLLDSGHSANTDEFRQTIMHTQSVLSGALSSYSGQVLGLNLDVGHAMPSNGTGLSGWIGLYDPELEQAIHNGLILALADTRQLLEAGDKNTPETVTLTLEGLQEKVTGVLTMLESQVLPLTQSTLVAN